MHVANTCARECKGLASAPLSGHMTSSKQSALAAAASTRVSDALLAALPILPSLWLLLLLADANKQSAVTFFVLCVAGLGCFAFLLTSYLVPHIAQFTLAKRLFGKDLGKKGTERESVDV